MEIIFLSRSSMAIKRDVIMVKFQSPYWGLFFYLIRENLAYQIKELMKFPSPYWGLLFYRTDKYIYINGREDILFPSPYWGLFFIIYKKEIYYLRNRCIVSVPILGIIFLFLPFIGLPKNVVQAYYYHIHGDLYLTQEYHIS